MTSIIRDLKNARKVYMKKPFIERDPVIKAELDKRIKLAKERHFEKVNDEKHKRLYHSIRRNRKIKVPESFKEY
jgi:hypothetical protein